MLCASLIVSIISYLSPQTSRGRVVNSAMYAKIPPCLYLPDGAFRHKRRLTAILSRATFSSADGMRWANLNFSKSVQVTVPFESTGIYDFTGGAFLLGTRLHITRPRPAIGYSYVTLPSLSSTETEEQNLKWHGLGLGIQILDVGLAVHGHDLIALLTAYVSPAISSLNKLTSEEATRQEWPKWQRSCPGNTVTQLFHQPAPSFCQGTHHLHSINKPDSRSLRCFDRDCRRFPRSPSHLSVGAGRERGYVLSAALEKGWGTLRESLAATSLSSLLRLLCSVALLRMGRICILQFPHGRHTRHSQPPAKYSRDCQDCRR